MLSKLSLFEQSILGYLPTTIIKILLNKKESITTSPLPVHFNMNTIALYADISHFIQFSVNYANKARLNPEFLQFCLNRYLEQLISIISTNGGDIIKFAGDAIIVIWPMDENEERNERIFLSKASHRAVQCALDIQKKLKNKEIANGKSFNIKIGIGIGECKLLIVGGELRRFEYLCAGKAINQACEGEKNARNGGDIVVSEDVYKYVKNYFSFEVIAGKKSYVVIYNNKNIRCRIASRANANLIRQKFNTNDIVKKSEILKLFIPVAIQLYLQTQNEKWCNEIRIVSIMFIKLNFDFSTVSDSYPDTFSYIQEIIRTIQQCSYATKGSLNKFLMDDKGSVVLLAWGLPPFSSEDDAIHCVATATQIWRSLRERGCETQIGVTSGVCFSGICGTSGSRREYSVLGEVVNLAAVLMEMAKEVNEEKYKWKIVIDETTRTVIQKRIRCVFWRRERTKGYNNQMNFYIPIEGIDMIKVNETNGFPFIRTWFFNSIAQEELRWRDRKESDEEEEWTRGNLCGVEKIIEKMSVDDFYKNSMFMIGNTRKMENTLKYIMTHCLNDNENIVIQITGYLGIGKSLFLRNVINELFKESNQLKTIYFKLHKKVILYSLPTEIEAINPFSRFISIFKPIITLLNSLHLLDKLNDEDPITANQSDSYLNPLYRTSQSVMSSSSSLPIIANSDKVFSYFRSVLLLYKKYIQSPILILLLEDTHIIDSTSLSFIHYLLNYNDNILLLVSFRIALYRSSLSPPSYLPNRSLNINLKQFFSFDKIFALSQRYIQASKSLTISSISQPLLSFIFSKSFNGIPLFILTLVHTLLASNLVFVSLQTMELKASPRLVAMIDSNDLSEMNIPLIIEKFIGSIIDDLPSRDVISLKLASVIGDLFDNKKLKSLMKLTTNFTLSNSEMYSLLISLEEKNIIEILYDLDIDNKFVVCKFAIPFLREVLYSRLLLEQKSQCHSLLGKMLKNEDTKRYLSKEKELYVLEKHLKYAEMSIYKEIESPSHASPFKDTKINFHNLKFLIVKKIVNKLDNTERNKTTLIKGGIVNKKSDGKITWEERYFALNNKSLSYYYSEKDFKENSVPLGFFYLNNVVYVKKLSDYEIGNKTNIFALAVNQWMKKNETKNYRVYYLSVESKEDLFDWVISMNVLKVKALYEDYIFKFGFIRFPLYKSRKNENCFKNKKIPFELSNSITDTSFSNPYYCYGSLSITKTTSLKKTRRLSLFSSPLSLSSKEINNSKVNLSVLTSLIKYTFSFFISNIQTHIYHTIHSREFDFESPSHLSFLFSVLSSELRSHFFTVNITSQRESDGEKYYRKHKREIVSSFDSRTMSAFLNEDDVGSFNDKGEEKIDQEDYLKYQLYIDKEICEESVDNNQKDEESSEDDDEYAGLRSRTITKNNNTINEVCEDKSEHSSEVNSTKSNLKRVKEESFDSIEKKTYRDNSSNKEESNVSESEETKEEVKYSIDDDNKQQKITKVTKEQRGGTVILSTNTKNDFDFGALLRSYSVQNAMKIRKDIERSKNKFNTDKNLSLSKLESKKLIESKESKKDSDDILPLVTQSSITVEEPKSIIRQTIFPLLKESIEEKQKEEDNNNVDSFSLKNLSLRQSRNSIVSLSNTNNTINITNNNDEFSLRNQNLDVINKLKSLDMSIDNEEQYISNVSKKTFYTSYKSSNENDLDSYSSIPLKIYQDSLSMKLNYITSSTNHRKVHKSNFFSKKK